PGGLRSLAAVAGRKRTPFHGAGGADALVQVGAALLFGTPWRTLATSSHREDQGRIVRIPLITKRERQRLWVAGGIILPKIRLVEVFEQINWSGIGTEEPQCPTFRGKVAERNAGVILKDRRAYTQQIVAGDIEAVLVEKVGIGLQETICRTQLIAKTKHPLTPLQPIIR